MENNGNGNPICVTEVSLATLACKLCKCFVVLNGRYVNIINVGRGKLLTLCEVKVFVKQS